MKRRTCHAQVTMHARQRETLPCKVGECGTGKKEQQSPTCGCWVGGGAGAGAGAAPMGGSGRRALCASNPASGCSACSATQAPPPRPASCAAAPQQAAPRLRDQAPGQRLRVLLVHHLRAVHGASAGLSACLAHACPLLNSPCTCMEGASALLNCIMHNPCALHVDWVLARAAAAQQE